MLIKLLAPPPASNAAEDASPEHALSRVDPSVIPLRFTFYPIPTKAVLNE